MVKSIRRFSLLITLFCAVLYSAGAQESGENALPPEMMEKSLYIFIGTSIVGQQVVASPGFVNAFYRITIPGKPLTVRLRARDGRIIVSLTPYRTGDNQFVLVVQNEVWAKPAESDSLQFYTSFNSIPLVFGEKAVFYPMGKKNEGEYIQMIIVVVPWQWIVENNIDPDTFLAGFRP